MSDMPIALNSIRLGFLLTVIVVVPVPASATITECRRLLMTGKYNDCLRQAREAIERRAYGEDWPLVKVRAERELGLYEDALATAEAGIERYPWSIRILVEKFHCCRDLGQNELASECLAEIDRLASAAPWRYSDADDLVALGQAALEAGADPKDVLEGFFERARRNFSRRPEGHLAAAQLALDKGDLQLAAEILAPAVEKFPENPDILFARFLSIRGSDPVAAEAARQAALKINPTLTKALLADADRRIDREEFDAAAKTLSGILDRNPRHPESGALLAALRLLRNQSDEAALARSKALEHNPQNPEVDHRIGATLSRRYRFAEGAAWQRRALESDSEFLPARIQLAQDLLRLGRSDEGWQLTEQAHKRDGYNTQLFNLLQLRDSMDRFAVVRDDRFILHMPRDEAAVFGDQVIALLNSAWNDLTVRYGFVPPEPVVVEIFDRPEDFAVRTFGLPDVAGFLGVCFGRVITANSPTSQRRSPVNWESVLWHEFTHVITLQMTSNRIPRWLSEGISVYEERRRDSRCGQRMSPVFRDRILDGRVTPVTGLSSAFLEAEPGEDMNFAYYQSSMVVEFLLEQYGQETLIAVLKGLNSGLLINDVLERQTTDPGSIDESFRFWITSQAQAFASGVEFDTESISGVDDIVEYSREHPQHYRAGLLAARQLEGADPAAAEAELLRLVKLFPHDASAEAARRVLADLYRKQGRAGEEARVLEDHLKVTAEAPDAAARLMDLRMAEGDWPRAVICGEQILAVDPGNARLLRQLVEAAENADRRELAIRCLRGLLKLDPSAGPRWRIHIAQLIRDRDQREARRQILLALEAAPRFRAAHRLLLELNAGESPIR